MKKGKYISLALCVICLSLFCTGCTDRGAKRELNSLAIVLGIAIDAADEKDAAEFDNFGDESDRLLLTSQVVRNISVSQNSSQSESAGSGGGSEGDLSKPYWNVQTQGANLLETLRSAVHITNRKLYIAQNQVVIISKELAEKGIVKYMDYFFRDQESRYDVNLVIAEEKAGEVLDTVSHLESLPAQDLNKLIKRQKSAAQSPECTLFSFVREYKTPFKSTLVPMVRVIEPEEEEEKSPFLYVAGSAVFKDGKMVTQLDENQTRGALWMQDDVQLGVLALKYKDAYTSIELIDGSGGYSVEYKDGKIKLKADIKATGVLGELQGSQELNPTVLEDLKKLCVDEIKNEIHSAFDEVRSAGADIYGIGEHFYRSENKTWKTMQEHFEDLYKNAELEVEVDMKIIRTGSLIEPADENGGEQYD